MLGPEPWSSLAEARTHLYYVPKGDPCFVNFRQ